MERFEKTWKYPVVIISAIVLLFQLVETITGNPTLFTGIASFIALLFLGSVSWDFAFAQSSVEGFPRYQYYWVARLILAPITILALFSLYYVVSLISWVPACCSFSPTETPIFTSTPSNTSTLTSTSPATATFTASPTSTSTPTPTPIATFTPTVTQTPMATINPYEFRGLDKGCIHQNYWNPNHLVDEPKEIYLNNCWNLSGWGILAQNGKLIFEVEGLKQNITRKMYTPINGDVDIKLTVSIEQFSANKDLDGIFMMGVGRPTTLRDYGYYLLFIQDFQENKTFRRTGLGTTKLSDKYAVFELGKSHNIIFRISGTMLKIIVDGVVIMQNDNSKEDDRSVFWISYTLPANSGSLNATISNFRIEDTKP